LNRKVAVLDREPRPSALEQQFLGDRLGGPIEKQLKQSDGTTADCDRL
jgi:hypothetical protein